MNGAQRGAVRGRPRRPEADEAILQAAFEILSLAGFARMSIDAVARRAEVTRPMVYRRWATKEALAVAALAHAQEGIADLPDSGNTRADLIAHLRSLQQTLFRPFGMAIIGSMLAEEQSTPSLLKGFRLLVVEPRRQPIRDILSRMRVDGVALSLESVELATDALVGACYARYISGRPLPNGWAEMIVDLIMSGVR